MKFCFQFLFSALFLFFPKASLAQEILPMTGSPTLFCRYEVDGSTTLLKLTSNPVSYTSSTFGKELGKLKRKRRAKQDTLAGLKAELSSLPKTDRYQARRDQLKKSIDRLRNIVTASKALENTISNCRDRELIQADSMTISIVKVTNTLSNQYYLTAYASKPAPLKISKNVSIYDGQFCLTFNGSGEIPFNFTSGTEASIQLTQSICPENSSIQCEPAIPASHVGWRIYIIYNPPNIEDAYNYLTGRIGDLAITARPALSDLPCRGAP